MFNKGIHIFGGSTGQAFARKMCAYLGIELGKSETIQFSDGNLFVKIGESVRDQDVYLVQPIGLKPNDEFTEILFWMDAFKRASVKSVTAIIPYFGYAKGDKKDEPRVSIRARVCAECIELAGADRILTMDLHSPQIQGFFKKPVDHLYALPLLSEYVKSLQLENIIVVSPDVGFAKQARNYASVLQVPVAISEKMRKDHHSPAEVLEVIGNVEGKNALIVDDFSVSGGTLVDVARVLKEKGAGQIYAALSHLLVNETGLKKIEQSSIECVISTDSLFNPFIMHSPKIKQISVAPLFAEAVHRIHHKESLSSLFDSVSPAVIQYAY